MSSSRQYVKRVWRVPKDRGPVEYLAALITKALIKHGWPVVVDFEADHWGGAFHSNGFQLRHFELGMDASSDFWQAVSIACRITARSYRVDIHESNGCVSFERPYIVTAAGVFREIPQE